MRIGFWTALAGLALAACSHSSGGASNQVSETQRLQDEAVQAFERAAEAQHRATEEQAKAEEAHRRLIEVQRSLAEAQAKALAQSAKAEQSQREARQVEQQEHQQVSRAQQQAMQMQRAEARTIHQIQQGNLQNWTQEKQVSGTAIDANSDVVLVRSRGRADLRLKVNDSTAVNLDGKQGDPSAIQPGSDVRASYQVIDGEPTALKLDVKSKHKATKATSSPATDAQGKDTVNEARGSGSR